MGWWGSSLAQSTHGTLGFHVLDAWLAHGEDLVPRWCCDRGAHLSCGLLEMGRWGRCEVVECLDRRGSRTLAGKTGGVGG